MAVAKRSRATRSTPSVPSKPLIRSNIQQFTQITKSRSPTNDAGSNKSFKKVDDTIIQEDVDVSFKKRKRDEEQSSGEEGVVSTSDVRSDATKRRKVQDPRSKLHFTPSKSRGPIRTDNSTTALPTPEHTPVKVVSTSDPLHLGIAPFNAGLDTPPSTPTKTPYSRNSGQKLPDELLDLLDLSRSFLRGLSLHYAHHGAASPVDTRILRPVISKIWTKRAVTLEDIQRIIGIMQAEITTKRSKKDDALPTFWLTEYSRGKVCIERPELKGRCVVSRHIDEERLNEAFARALSKLWEEWKCSEPADKTEHVLSYIAQLPLEPITKSPSLQKSITSTLINGQLRLEDLKDVALKSQSSDIPAPVATSSKTPTALNQRSSSLLQRLKSKEADRAARPAPPSPAQIARRATLQRLPSIIATLPLPRTESLGGQRYSYALPMLVQSVQDSHRSVVGKEEVEGCLRLLADEAETFGAQGFIRFIGVGIAEAVVLDWSRRPADLLERISQASER